MNAPVYDRHGIAVYHGDCLEVMRTLPDESAHAIVTDPPAGARFMNKAWDSDMGGRHSWVAWLAERMREARRVLKPGGYGLVWALPRTAHWTAWALEDAGFEIRDCIVHIFGAGMPKSKSQLKPAAEHWWLIRKPMPGTAAQTVLQHGTGALNIGACRVAMSTADADAINAKHAGMDTASYRRPAGASLNLSTNPMALKPAEAHAAGRWPANLVLTHAAKCDDDGCRPEWCPVAELDAQSGFTASSDRPRRNTAEAHNRTSSMGRSSADWTTGGHSDEGGASRFFHTFRWEAKAPPSERPMVGGKAHETVKPLGLIRFFVKLVCAPGGTVLDCFAGTGTTGQAARAEGMKAILIEQDGDHIDKIRARLDARPKTTAAQAKPTDDEPLDLLDLLDGNAS